MGAPAFTAPDVAEDADDDEEEEDDADDDADRVILTMLILVL